MLREDEEVEREQDFQEKLETASVTSEKIKDTIKEVEKRLEQQPKNSILKQAKRPLEKDLCPVSKNMKATKKCWMGAIAFRRRTQTRRLCV